MQTILSGIQSTGDLHLGNYIGSIKNWVKLQKDYRSFFFLADLHSITMPIDPKELRESIFSATAIYLACGIDPDKSAIFTQSSVPAHSELAWIFNCVTPIGRLRRMTQYKDKGGENEEKICLGLFAYPVLMAADILLYKPDFVPVGDDQKQHLEMTRDIAVTVNSKFGKEIFKLPEPLITGVTTRVMSLRDGRKKMSKSDRSSDYARINLKDSPDIIRDKIKKAATDSFAEIAYDKANRPEVANLLEIYSSLSEEPIKNLVEKYSSSGFASFKKDLAEVIISVLEPIRLEYIKLSENRDYLSQILLAGKEKASKKAEETLSEIKNLFGFAAFLNR